MRHNLQMVGYIFGVAAVAVVLGCSGGGGGGGTTAAAASITSFSASPNEVYVGQSVTISATFTGGTGVVEPGSLAIKSGTPLHVTAAGSGAEVFTLTVTGTDGIAIAPQTASVLVNPIPAMALVPSASTVTAGANISFLVSIPESATATVEGVTGTFTNGQVVTIPAVSAASSQTVTMVVALAPGVTQTVSSTVAIAAPPQATNLVASPISVVPGGISSLTPTFSGGAGFIDGGIGVVTSGVAYPTSPLQVGQTFNLMVTNAAGATATASVTIGVITSPTITSFSASTLSPQYGGVVNLTGVFVNGTGTIDNGVGAVQTGVEAPSGPVTAPTVFTLTVVDAAGVSRTATVSVTPQTVVVSGLPVGSAYLTASKTKTFNVSATGMAAPAFAWSVDGILGGNETVGTITQAGVYVGPSAVGSHVITATATNGGGASQSVTVKIVAPPVIESFTLS